jgi:hypothetical protein
MKEQLVMDNKEVQEKFNRYKDTVVCFKFGRISQSKKIPYIM